MIAYDCSFHRKELLDGCLFEQGKGTTLLLNNITALTAGEQLRLLEVLHEREKEQDLSAAAPARSMCRIIATCDYGIRDKLASKEFREDLYYRLSTVCIQMSAVHELRGLETVLVPQKENS